MKCFNPFFKRMPEGVVCFPCGNCPTCRASQSMIWSLRMHLESMYYKENAFITLTYSPEHLPEFSSLKPSHLQSFFKRLRRHLPYRIRYYACGEYGDRFGRPHYHAVIFGLKQEDFPLVHKSWSFGMVDCQVPNMEAFQYVAGYVNKKLGKVKEWKFANPYQVPPFQRCSLGLGLRFIMEQVPFFSPILKLGDKIRYIGRYLRNKLADKFGILEQVKKQGIEALVASLETVVSEFFYHGGSVDDRDTIHKNIFPFLEYQTAWRWKYQGYFDDFIARKKLRYLNYKGYT